MNGLYLTWHPFLEFEVCITDKIVMLYVCIYKLNVIYCFENHFVRTELKDRWLVN